MRNIWLNVIKYLGGKIISTTEDRRILLEDRRILLYELCPETGWYEVYILANNISVIFRSGLINLHTQSD